MYSSVVKDQKKTAAQIKAAKQVVAIEKILANFEKQMAEGKMKATLADYMRLLQLKKEMSEEAVTAITVTWVESPPPEK
jgi:uncharacterized protein with FMN-binding domain